ncbi:MAG: MFS transporter [candidate division WOR-3 bacterium]|nr:MFS transporter [candidate division WOR-3 bacterium]
MTVLVSAFGYFVDIYDLSLFGILRVQSLIDLGYENKLFDYGVLLLNMQMFGMLVGGIIWGIIGDTIGRKTILFGSILLFSIGNILNAFVVDIYQYAILRFITGIGLAGELGAAITLVSEILDKEIRGYGTTIVASFGLLGAVFASITAEFFHWRVMYFIGGILGILLFFLRLKTMESSIFERSRVLNIKRGDFIGIFTNVSKFRRYTIILITGLPIWFVFSILITFSPEVAKSLNLNINISAGKSIMFAYLGISLGDAVSGILSQRLKSRKKPIYIFLLLLFIVVLLYLYFNKESYFVFYFYNFLLGFFAGYWVLFLTAGAEQFGTNIRATVVSTLPNFIRGSVVLITLSFNYIKSYFDFITSAVILGTIIILVAFISTLLMEETFAKDLDYVE